MDVTQHVNTILKVTDQASGPLAKAAAHADKAQKAIHGAQQAGHAAGGHEGGAQGFFNTLQNMAGIGGIVGAAFSFHSAIESTEKYMEKLKETSELAKSTVSETDFLFSSARKAGVEYDVMAQTMFQLSKRGAMVATSQAAMANQIPGMAKRFKALGVDITKGPVHSIESMAAGVKAGKIGASELMGQFRIPQKAANDMEEFLRELDPKKLAAARKGGGGLIGEDTMDDFKRIEKAQHRMNDAWNRIKVTVITKLYPVVANMAEAFADKLEKFLPKLERAMKFVANHMNQIVFAAKAFVAVMSVKKGIGMLGKAANSGIITKMVGPAAPGLAGSVAQLAAAGPYLAVIAAAVWVLYQGWKAIDKNVGGLKDKFLWIFDNLEARFDMIMEAIDGAVRSLMGSFGESTSGLGESVGKVFIKLMEFTEALVAGVTAAITATNQWLGQLMDFGFVLVENWRDWVVDPIANMMVGLGQVIAKVMTYDVFGAQRAMEDLQLNAAKAIATGVMHVAKATGKMQSFGDLFQGALKSQLVEANKRAILLGQERKKKEKHGEDAREKNVYDFRGSRFDITQNFAEGFDPDRIAVAFSNDLANLGEMRSQSGFSPITAAG